MLLYNCQKERNKNKEKETGIMKNIKTKIETSDMVQACISYVDFCIEEMNKGNIEMAKYYALQAHIVHKALNIFSYKKNADFSSAYDELASETHIYELFKYPDIAYYINNELV